MLYGRKKKILFSHTSETNIIFIGKCSRWWRKKSYTKCRRIFFFRIFIKSFQFGLIFCINLILYKFYEQRCPCIKLSDLCYLNLLSPSKLESNKRIHFHFFFSPNFSSIRVKRTKMWFRCSDFSFFLLLYIIFLRMPHTNNVQSIWSALTWADLHVKCSLTFINYW